MINIQELIKADTAALHHINGLLKQLAHHPSTYRPISMKRLREIIKEKNSVVITIRDGEKIIGIGMLLVIKKFKGVYGYIEDMIVDKTYRGKGYGRKIAVALIAAAKKRKVTVIELSSRPNRVPANALYQELGFLQKETNTYSLKLK